VFLYKEVLRMPLGELEGLVSAKKPRRSPSVLTRDEVRQLLASMDDATLALMVKLMYGTGMRLMECVRLRVMVTESLVREFGRSSDGQAA
jgi:integrase